MLSADDVTICRVICGVSKCTPQFGRVFLSTASDWVSQEPSVFPYVRVQVHRDEVLCEGSMLPAKFTVRMVKHVDLSLEGLLGFVLGNSSRKGGFEFEND